MYTNTHKSLYRLKEAVGMEKHYLTHSISDKYKGLTIPRYMIVMKISGIAGIMIAYGKKIAEKVNIECRELEPTEKTIV